MSHTPGPWKAKITSVSAGGIKITQSGHIGGACVQSDQRAFEQRISNARLIAAAPDLLAACKVLLYSMEHEWPDHWINSGPAVMLRAAIAKAEAADAAKEAK